jgi:hypothetical protein
MAQPKPRNQMPAGTLRRWVAARREAMKTFSVLAMTAILVATGAAAQNLSGNEVASAARSDVGHQTQTKKRIAKPHGGSAFASVPRSRAVNAFDGDWSVLIQTRDGNCDPAYRYGVQIQNGEIQNGGSAPVTVEGRVAPSGAVQVSVSAGSQEAHGAGRLSRTSGTGTWRGEGSLGTCAGTWVAERRE